MIKSGKAQVSKKAAKTTTLMVGSKPVHIPTKLARVTRTMSLRRRFRGFVFPPAPKPRSR